MAKIIVMKINYKQITFTLYYYHTQTKKNI